MQSNKFLEDPAFLSAQIKMGDELGQFPVVITSDSIRPRTIPYSAPTGYSAMCARASLYSSMAQNPPNEVLTGAFTGVASVSVGLPGAPGIATSADRQASYAAYVIDVSRSDNIAATPFSLNGAGQFAGEGETYSTPTMEFVWDDSSITGWIVV